MSRSQFSTTAGVIVGSAVGDALGGPFEFGPQGAFSARFPAPGAGGEMCGGGGWDPGEATDDTQMAILVAESLLEQGWPHTGDVCRAGERSGQLPRSPCSAV
ncbi:ADP-ribosylglycohydrolase family protein [Streptomyces sp. NPDC007056]|uniref:ADP-ribosylglycohydrolase family protein n=1 Tax=unclassified Streptomyces TaxID=2593676 RepID=UPI0033EDE990